MNDDISSIRQAFQIDTPQVDQEALAERVAANVALHALRDPPGAFPQFAISPAQPGNPPRFASEVYTGLAQACETRDRVWVEMTVMESAWPLAARLKRAFHQLVIYYVNRLGERQMEFNNWLLRVVNYLVSALEQPDPEVAELRRQVAELRARIETLEKERP